MRRIPWSCVPFLFVATAPLSAATKSFEVTVAAGPQDRLQVPVRLALTLPAALADAASVVLQDAGGKPIAGQLTAPGLISEPVAARNGEVRRDLHFILPRLKAGESMTLKATVSTEASGKVAGFRWQDTPGDHLDLRFGDRPVLRYMYKALDDSTRENRELTYKVFHHLYDPTGQRLVTKGAGGLYTHHRGLFFGFNRVTYGDGKRVDIWHCTGDTHQSHERVVASEAGPVLGRHCLEIAWRGAKKQAFAVEERELTVFSVPGGQLVEFASRVRSTGGKVRLDGDPQHAGFHFRADNEVAAKTSKSTYYVRPDGVGKPGETRNWDPKTKQGPVNLPWNAMSFVLGGRRYTAVYLDKPANPKEARYSERDYGRFGSYFEYELDTTRPLEVNYRLWLQEGEITVPQAADLTANFVEPPAVMIR
jgi:hypothetical protein